MQPTETKVLHIYTFPIICDFITLFNTHKILERQRDMIIRGKNLANVSWKKCMGGRGGKLCLHFKTASKSTHLLVATSSTSVLKLPGTYFKGSGDQGWRR